MTVGWWYFGASILFLGCLWCIWYLIHRSERKSEPFSSEEEIYDDIALSGRCRTHQQYEDIE